MKCGINSLTHAMGAVAVGQGSRGARGRTICRDTRVGSHSLEQYGGLPDHALARLSRSHSCGLARMQRPSRRIRGSPAEFEGPALYMPREVQEDVESRLCIGGTNRAVARPVAQGAAGASHEAESRPYRRVQGRRWRSSVVVGRGDRGAGLTGLSAAVRFAQEGVELALFEKSKWAGGVWRSYGNPFSRVNSTEPGYRLGLVQRRAPNTNHSHRHEILADCARAIEQFELKQRVFGGVDVRSVERLCNGHGESWRVGCIVGDERREAECRWTVLCTNRRLGLPRELHVAGEERFAGAVRRGLSGDAVDLDWAGERVLILGHGPYATENARTALEHGASHVTFGVRRHGIVCPELIDYVNYIREYDEGFGHPRSGSARIVSTWRQVYRESGATPPEVWSEGRFLPDGHTVSISDLYFVAHHMG